MNTGTMPYTLVNNIEKLIITFLENLISCKQGICKFKSRRNQNLPLIEQIISCKSTGAPRFSICFYILMEAHNRLLAGDKCTLRELYYKDPAKCCKPVSISKGVIDVCAILQTVPWNLGIFATGKGLIAGAIRFHMINGDMIDCFTHGGAVVLPQDHNSINRLETSATFVLVVEKETVFSKLISQKIFENLGMDIILMTGRGYPDLSTRYIINRLSTIHKLPIYALFDADPFGIEILLIYQFGSRKMSREISKNLICPKMRWIGIHPTELVIFNFPHVALSANDNRKLQRMLRYSYIKDGIRFELQTLQHLQRKIHIDELHSISELFLLNDYMPNKIKRNLML
ncbi:meiotic recombination protein W68 [Eurosta solidaginis]|uniref:meiotic recombination protein W68 n=1 Tax=Eurosta solidaginis TaxID=178769 RepID=UPI003530F2F4